MPRKLLDKTFKTKNGTNIFLNEHKEFQPIELKQWTDILYDDKPSLHFLRAFSFSSVTLWSARAPEGFFEIFNCPQAFNKRLFNI